MDENTESSIVRSQVGESMKRIRTEVKKMKKEYKILAVGTIFSLILGVFFAIGYNHFNSNKVYAQAEKGTQTLSIEEALKKYHSM
ncbi:hypothetical protein [Paenibacillus apiarius]|uniref:hypothetical protein n=1 Tax=Paenibacillus apiarius TaxID=46240 RepID=UPI0019812D47|nr:hypothetical protein [Paenibacillus apiarius]MBN3525184.1 hypothetical protein [Paenibacillus apiarius]